jgi:cation:H+ antiporter
MEYIGFLVCAIIIFLAGRKLSHYGELLAEKTGVSKGWIGLILMAFVTSLPELIVGISSSAIVKSADLAVGDILGSCSFNLGILALLDAFTPKKKTLFGMASQSQILNTSLGIIALSIVGFALFIPITFKITSWIALSGLMCVAIYFVSIHIIYRNEKKNAVAVKEEISSSTITSSPSLSRIVVYYAFFATTIVLAALALPHFAEKIAISTGLGQSFVGTLFLAASTSLPEIAVSIAAMRSGSIDMAVGNLLGSNIFNVFILAIDEVFYTSGILLNDASKFHLISVFCTVIMSAIAIAGLNLRNMSKRFFLALDSAFIFGVYVIGLILLYHFTS